jgi:hypothetical protein
VRQFWRFWDGEKKEIVIVVEENSTLLAQDVVAVGDGSWECRACRRQVRARGQPTEKPNGAMLMSCVGYQARRTGEQEQEVSAHRMGRGNSERDKSPKLATWEFPIGELDIWGISGELFLKKIAIFEYKKRFTEALEVALNFTQSSALQTGYENKIPWTVTKHSCWSATLIYSRQTCVVFHS